MIRASVLSLLCIVFAACGDPPAAVQPIAFNHKIHAGDEQVPCIDCHVGAESSAHASLPALSGIPRDELEGTSAEHAETVRNRQTR